LQEAFHGVFQGLFLLRQAQGGLTGAIPNVSRFFCFELELTRYCLTRKSGQLIIIDWKIEYRVARLLLGSFALTN
jgi:hypothetical protein